MAPLGYLQPYISVRCGSSSNPRLVLLRTYGPFSLNWVKHDPGCTVGASPNPFFLNELDDSHFAVTVRTAGIKDAEWVLVRPHGFPFLASRGCGTRSPFTHPFHMGVTESLPGQPRNSTARSPERKGESPRDKDTGGAKAGGSVSETAIIFLFSPEALRQGRAGGAEGGFTRPVEVQTAPPVLGGPN